MLRWCRPIPWIIHIAFFSPSTGDGSKLPLDVDDIKLLWITFTIALMHKHSCIAVQPHRLYDPGPLYLYYTAHKEYYLSIRYAPSCTCRTNSILCTTCTLWGYDRRRCIHRLMAKLMTKLMAKLMDAFTSMSCSEPFLRRLVCTQASIWPNCLIVGGVTGITADSFPGRWLMCA